MPETPTFDNRNEQPKSPARSAETDQTARDKEQSPDQTKRSQERLNDKRQRDGQESKENSSDLAATEAKLDKELTDEQKSGQATEDVQAKSQDREIKQ